MNLNFKLRSDHKLKSRKMKSTIPVGKSRENLDESEGCEEKHCAEQQRRRFCHRLICSVILMRVTELCGNYWHFIWEL